jgi:hypothetical protein
MKSQLIRETSRITLALALGVALTGTAAAADMGAGLGGDCCADLEERVTELEQTAVKHGNRKVSLVISGSVTEAVVFWDDGYDRDINVIQPDSAGAGFNLAGEGRITSDVSVGYNINLDVRFGDPVDSVIDGVSDPHSLQHYNNKQSKVAISQQYVSLKSASVGTLEMGYRNSTYKSFNGAFDLSGDDANITSYNGGLVDTAAGLGIVESTGAFTGASWYGALSNFGGDKDMSVRYNSPEWSGFAVSGSWGGDDLWSVGASFNRDFDGTSVAMGAAYESNNTNLAEGRETDKWLVGGSVHNAPSGLFITIEYDTLEYAVDDFHTTDVVRVDADNLFVKGGWRRDVSGIGETTVWGEWMRTEGASAVSIHGGATVFETVGQAWGVGVAQHIDTVNAALFLSYQQREVTDNAFVVCGGTGHCNDLSTVLAGMQVKF